jgi:hypothetical protein
VLQKPFLNKNKFKNKTSCPSTLGEGYSLSVNCKYFYSVYAFCSMFCMYGLLFSILFFCFIQELPPQFPAASFEEGYFSLMGK